MTNSSGVLVTPSSPAAKFAAGLIGVAIAVAAAITSAGDGAVSPGSAVQIALVGVGAVGIFLLPLVGPHYAATAKVTLAVVTAVLTAVLPLAIQGGGIGGTQIVVVVLAGLQALGAAVGVGIRREALGLAA
jgi:hypothetical protein